MFLAKSSRLRFSDIKASDDYPLIDQSLKSSYFVLVACSQISPGDDVVVSFRAALNIESIEVAFRIRRELSEDFSQGWVEVVSPKELVKGGF